MVRSLLRKTKLNQHARRVDERFEQTSQQFFAVGTVTAISAPTVTVTVRGASLVMHKLATYSPTVGDVVQIAWPPGRPFVLGKLG